MTELIKVTTNEQGQKVVSARELYDGLGLNKANWKRWSEQNIVSNEYFKENVDWVGFIIMMNGNETRDYAITLEFAKHIAMMARTELSHQYRNYFIECEKQLITNIKLSTPRDEAKADLELMQVVSDFLGLNDSSKLLITHQVFKKHHLPSEYLPKYTDSKGQLLSATDLLARHGVDISTIAFNKLMMKLGYIVELERVSKSKGVKKFKSLTNLEFGENQVSPNNPKETQILYYEHKFEDLLKTIGLI